MTNFQPWDVRSRGPGTEPESCPCLSTPSPARPPPPMPPTWTLAFLPQPQSVLQRENLSTSHATSSKTNSRNTITRAAQEASQLGHMTHSSKQKKRCGEHTFNSLRPPLRCAPRGTAGTEREGLPSPHESLLQVASPAVSTPPSPVSFLPRPEFPQRPSQVQGSGRRGLICVTSSPNISNSQHLCQVSALGLPVRSSVPGDSAWFPGSSSSTSQPHPDGESCPHRSHFQAVEPGSEAASLSAGTT